MSPDNPAEKFIRGLQVSPNTGLAQDYLNNPNALVNVLKVQENLQHIAADVQGYLREICGRYKTYTGYIAEKHEQWNTTWHPETPIDDNVVSTLVTEENGGAELDRIAEEIRALASVSPPDIETMRRLLVRVYEIVDGSDTERVERVKQLLKLQ